MIVIYLIGFVAWAVPTAAAVWYLATFREVYVELKLIRRYLQEIHERTARPR